MMGYNGSRSDRAERHRGSSFDLMDDPAPRFSDRVPKEQGPSFPPVASIIVLIAMIALIVIVGFAFGNEVY